MFFKVLSLTYHSPITSTAVTWRRPTSLAICLLDTVHVARGESAMRLRQQGVASLPEDVIRIRERVARDVTPSR
jgi:hypothetical protein